ncbi:hypothetical protein M422DRAFT_265912 [Sphaerobolus stellatus SS14]|uniref:Uncharacterized protein n=1 Tax=Sphaerobolus stellatus (strain SS14) TaxID=990650 RepID=A0A0C9TQ74_SPHS4|nr:hypothetical protein M422DRAFT_265912 [Sphaerobolus stellatus SS14]
MPNTSKFHVRIANVSMEEARGDKVKLISRRTAVETPWRQLDLTKDQWTLVQSLYEQQGLSLDGTLQDHVFVEEDDASQLEAVSLLASLSFDIASLEDIGCRWSEKWGQVRGKGSGEQERSLYQCDCGRDHTQFAALKRQTAVDFTGCLAHVEVTMSVHTQRVVRIRGFFSHNEGCRAAVLKRMPQIPLHPSVYKVALAQLKDGASLSAIQAKNRDLFHSRGYLEQPADLQTSPYQWMLLPHDTRTLYRQYSRFVGVNVTMREEINIDDWLDPNSPNYNHTLAEAVFHYAPRAEANERFEVCIATKEMKEAA